MGTHNNFFKKAKDDSFFSSNLYNNIRRKSTEKNQNPKFNKKELFTQNKDYYRLVNKTLPNSKISKERDSFKMLQNLRKSDEKSPPVKKHNANSYFQKSPTISNQSSNQNNK